MADLLVVADVQGGSLYRLQSGVVKGLDRGNDTGDAGFVIQMAGADKSISDFHSRVKRHEVAHLDP